MKITCFSSYVRINAFPMKSEVFALSSNLFLPSQYARRHTPRGRLTTFMVVKRCTNVNRSARTEPITTAYSSQLLLWFKNLACLKKYRDWGHISEVQIPSF